MLETRDGQNGFPGENLRAGDFGFVAFGGIEFDTSCKSGHRWGDTRGVNGLGGGDLKLPGNAARLNISRASREERTIKITHGVGS